MKKVKLPPPSPRFSERHYYGLIGLSTPCVFDEVVGAHVPHKLSEAEWEYMLEETEISDDLKGAIAESEQFFERAHPNNKVYYKNSRWSTTAPLQVLSVSQRLYEVGW